MICDEIARGYDAIADKWNDPGFPRENGIRQHELAFKFVKRKHYALDIGCGCSGRFIDLLKGCGFDVEGVDFSERMLELARLRHPDVTFHRADICEWTLPHDYDFITAWDSICHVPLAKHEAVMRKILAALGPDGVFIFTMGGLDEPSEKRDSAMGVPMYYSTLGIRRMLEVIAASGCICRHLQYDQYPASHVYVIAQKAST